MYNRSNANRSTGPLTQIAARGRQAPGDPSLKLPHFRCRSPVACMRRRGEAPGRLSFPRILSKPRLNTNIPACAERPLTLTLRAPVYAQIRYRRRRFMAEISVGTGQVVSVPVLQGVATHDTGFITLQRLFPASQSGVREAPDGYRSLSRASRTPATRKAIDIRRSSYRQASTGGVATSLTSDAGCSFQPISGREKVLVIGS